MNAPHRPVSLADVLLDRRAERRRLAMLSRMQATLHALGMELGRIGTLGDEARAEALLGFRTQLRTQVDEPAADLADECQELAEAPRLELESEDA